jgi:hypothetical protein
LVIPPVSLEFIEEGLVCGYAGQIFDGIDALAGPGE